MRDTWDIARRHRADLDKKQVADMHAIQDEVNELAKVIRDRTFPCRETSVALTNLEQASMWAVKSVTRERRIDPVKLTYVYADGSVYNADGDVVSDS